MTAPWWGDDPAAFSDERVIADPEPSAAEWGKQFDHLTIECTCYECIPRTRTTKRLPLRKRFGNFVHHSRALTCWRWVGFRLPNGYGTMGEPGTRRKVFAHRVAYELYAGPIPDGYQVDHLCRNPWCVNPAHLEAVTPQENNRRSRSLSAQRARQTQCVNGHPFTEQNTRIRSNGSRTCITCSQERQSKRYDTAAARRKHADQERTRRAEVAPDQYCPSCKYAWSVHDNSDPLTTGPFGCPTEITARLRWGR